MGVCAEALRAAIAVTTNTAPAVNAAMTFATWPPARTAHPIQPKGERFAILYGMFWHSGARYIASQKHFSHADERSAFMVKQTPPDIALQPSPNLVTP